MPLSTFVPIEPTLQADTISSLNIVTTATLSDGVTQLIVPNAAAIGDYLILQADGSYKLDAAADFDARYKAA